MFKFWKRSLKSQRGFVVPLIAMLVVAVFVVATVPIITNINSEITQDEAFLAIGDTPLREDIDLNGHNLLNVGSIDALSGTIDSLVNEYLTSDNGVIDDLTSTALAAVDAAFDNLSASVGRGTEILVAASNASALNKQQADYVCDGVSDETEINTAILSLENTYGTIKLSDGTFVVDGSIELQHGIKLIGSGKVATTIQCKASTSISEGMIHADGHWNRGLLQDFTIDGNENNSGDCMGIYLQGVWYSEVSRVEVKDCEDDGIYISGPDGGGYTGECYFSFVEVHEIQADGWHISAVMDSVWVDCYEWYAEEDGFHIIGNSNLFIHCHAWGDGWQAFEITTDAKHTTMIACSADMPGKHGFKVGACYESKFIACGVGGAGQITAHSYGFYMGCTYSQFIDCLFDDADGGMDYAFVEAGSADYNIFQGNMIRRVAVGPAVILGTHDIIRDNIGWVTKNWGSGTIDNGATSEVVTHGLFATPTRITITLREDPTNDIGYYWVGSENSTAFTVYVKNDPGASNLDFWWVAEVY